MIPMVSTCTYILGSGLGTRLLLTHSAQVIRGHLNTLASFPGSPCARTSDEKLGGAWERGYKYSMSVYVVAVVFIVP